MAKTSTGCIHISNDKRPKLNIKNGTKLLALSKCSNNLRVGHWLPLILTLACSQVSSVYCQACKPASDFTRHYNQVLNDHVIKTITANHMDCTFQCGELMGCRSINVYKDENGKEMCDLSKSSKSMSPGSMVSRAGYEYYELTSRYGCSTEKCLGSVDWKVFNASQFRLFNDRVTWGEARTKCRGHGGDLVSIHSQQEMDFISTELLPSAPRGNSSSTRLMMFLRLDGISDLSISLKGTASYKTVDGYKALYLDGNSQNYATTPPIQLKPRGFSIGAWVKLLTPASEGLLYGDWSSPYQFAVKIGKDGKVHLKLMFESSNTTTVSSVSAISSNVWTYVTASWDKNEHIAVVFINGTKEAEQHLDISEGALMSTNHDYNIGLDRNASSVLHGYVRELAVFNWPIGALGRLFKRMGRWDKRDSVWTGLNDLTQENTFTFSDGSPMSYQYWDDDYPKDNYEMSDCVLFQLETGSNYKWKDGTCGLELPYICRRKVN